MDSFDPYEGLPPEALQRLAQGGALQDEYSEVEKQIAQARALRDRNAGAGHTSILGAALGSLTDIGNGIQGSQAEASGLDRLAQIRAQQTKTRGGQLGAYVNAMGRVRPLSPAPLLDADAGGDFLPFPQG